MQDPHRLSRVPLTPSQGHGRAARAPGPPEAGAPAAVKSAGGQEPSAKHGPPAPHGPLCTLPQRPGRVSTAPSVTFNTV